MSQSPAAVRPAEEPDPIVNLNLDERIAWYHSPIDDATKRRLLQRSDWRGFRQVGLHLLLIVATGCASYYAYLHHAWVWLAVALYAHGTVYGFFGGGVAGHELCHRTVFKTKFWNEFFLWLTSIMGWANHVHFRTSHMKHHQLTVHKDLDLEVVLPAKLDWKGVLWSTTISLPGIWWAIKGTVRRSLGKLEGEWEQRIFPESNPELRQQMFNCSRIVLAVQVALILVFIYFKLWLMFALFTFAPFYASWLGLLVGFPQHAGLSSSVPDFRLCCRTYTTNPLFGFLYWQMNYHVEHHMYAAVPFWRLKDLRAAIGHDLPPAHDGLIPTWREILTILQRQKTDPTYVYVPPLPAPKQG